MNHDDYYIGLDLGQASDYTALAVLRHREVGGVPMFDCPHLDRFKLGTPYPEIVEKVGNLMGEFSKRSQPAVLLPDMTGVGRPVVDLIHRARIPAIPILITAGSQVTNTYDGWHVPKVVLVSATQILLQSGRLKFAKSLPLIQTLIDEMLNFKVKVTAKQNETYEAWREGDHDDLVLAVCMAAWFANMRYPYAAHKETEAETKKRIQEEQEEAEMRRELALYQIDGKIPNLTKREDWGKPRHDREISEDDAQGEVDFRDLVSEWTQ